MLNGLSQSTEFAKLNPLCGLVCVRPAQQPQPRQLPVRPVRPQPVRGYTEKRQA